MKIHFTSLGCARNLADTEKMMQLLAKEGHEMVLDACLADCLIVNTCGFLQSARKEGREKISSLLKEKKKKSFLLVTGCMLPLHQQFLEKAFSGEIDGFLPPKQEEKIAEMVGNLQKREKRNTIHRLPTLFTTAHFAYLKIADGCRKVCTFCLIPKIRGKLQSRREEEILQEFRHLLSLGIFEIVLVAQDLSDYGKDLGKKNGLVSLLKKMLLEKQHFWIRLHYLYPDAITEELLSLIQSDHRICPYFDLPLQHINDRILRLMHRPMTKTSILRTLERIRSSFPEAAIRATFMVGFPSETEKEFLELYHFLQENALDHVGIFCFSKEKETQAFHLPKQLPERVKKEREKRLAALQLEMVRKKNQCMIGKRMPVLVEKRHPASPYLVQGRSQREAPEVDSVIIINDIAPISAFGVTYPVEITGYADYDLIGRVVPKRGEKKYEL